jgi:cytoskeletal protein CcmA (bactofilin family)
MFSKKPEQTSPGTPARSPARPMASSTFSVIGADVTIRGDIEASADLHVDGAVIGDLVCASLVQGESSRVEGAIAADTARLAGTVKGTITVRELVILKSARIEGDVHYEALTIEQGAQVDGRFAPDAGKPKVQPAVLDLGKDDEQRLSLAS